MVGGFQRAKMKTWMLVVIIRDARVGAFRPCAPPIGAGVGGKELHKSTDFVSEANIYRTKLDPSL